MAVSSVAKTSIESIEAPVRFFQKNGTYSVASSTTAAELIDDIGCWLESARGITQVIIMGLENEGGDIEVNPKIVARSLYGVLALLEIVDGGVYALASRQKQLSMLKGKSVGAI